jgi:hypothetical protein
MRLIGKDGVVLSEARAREIAEEHAGSSGLSPNVIETERGWFFGWGEVLFGSKGLVVNKETGHVYVLGSAFSLERDLQMYDRGMDANRHDLVILEIADLDATVAFLVRLCPTVIDLSYEAGTVWRIPRPMTEDEIRAHLTNLPAIFPQIGLYFVFEAVEDARAGGFCVMDVLPGPKLPFD